MWDKLRKWIFDKIPYFLVGLLALVIIVINFPKVEWLIGWDNLSTELNVGMNISRNLSGVWQEYQGLGLLAGMAHMADLVRLLVQGALSHFVPTMYLRSGMNLSMLLIGSLGMVNLVRMLFSTKKYINWGAVLAGVFYLFNIGTVQNFWAVFEPYAWAYGFVPWLISNFVDYLSNGKKKSLVLFAIASLLATPMAYLQTIFVVYFFVLVCLSLGNILDYRRIGFTDKLKRIAIVLAVVFGVNSFWLLPQSYFYLTSVGVTVNAKMNTIATPEVELSNQSKGSLIDVLKMQGYWLDLHDITDKGIFGNLMKPWGQHLENRVVHNLQYILVGFICLGLMGMYIFNYHWKWSLSLVTVVMVGLMQNYNPPLGLGWLGLYELFPILDQIFRSSFTKVIVFESLLFSILFGVSLLILIDLSYKLFKKYYFVLIGALFGMMAICNIYVGLPILRGEMIYESMEQELPLEYLALNNYFRSMEDGRIVKLPASSLWGWQYNRWGYDGSGFLWYGIEQPILDRAFDVWSPYNEGFYNEFSTALYSENADQVRKVLDKYDVRFALLDESVIAPGQGDEILRITETKKVMEQLGAKQVFKEGFLTVWDMGSRGDQFVSAPSSYKWVIGDTSKVRKDVIWDQVGTYVSDNRETQRIGESNKSVNQTIYPFSQLMREEVEGVEYGEEISTLRSDLVGFENDMQPTRSDLGEKEPPQIIIPGWKEGKKVELSYSAKIDAGKLMINWEPVYMVNGHHGPKLENIEYSMGSKTSAWVSIGGSQVFVKDQGVKSVAKLMVGEPIQIKIYDGIGRSEDVVLGEKLLCGEGDKFSCYAIPLTKQNKDNLLQTISTYSGASSNMIEVCLDLEGEPYECANKVKTGSSPLVVMQGVNAGDRYWLDYVLKSREVKLEKPQVNWYPIIGTKTIESNAWSEFLSEKKYKLTSEKLEISVASQPNEYDFAKLGKAEVTNCDVLKRGGVEKKVTTKSQPTRSNFQSQLTHYVADARGAVCDYVDMPDLSTDSSYLMRMMGENVEGRSLKYFLYNTGSNRNDIEYLLGKGKFDQTFSLLPWTFDGNYSLNIETRSFGQYAENILEPVEVRWFPLEQIVGARVTTLRSDLVGFVNDLQPTKSDLRVTEIKKTGTWLYRVKVEGSGLLKLSQGYDEGWIAPPIKHVKVDGWANGWIIENSGEITIFYWPQLLEYLGFGLLGATIWVIYKSK